MPVTWAPTPEQVKALIPQRVNGQPFGEDTTPTAAQVTGLAEDVVAEVIGEVGPFDPTVVLNPTAPAEDQITLGDLARRAATLGTASQVEDSFFPEQQLTGAYGVESNGGNQHLYARYRRALETLRTQLDAVTGAGEFTGSVSTPLTTVANASRILDTP